MQREVVPYDLLREKVLALGWEDFAITTPEIPEADKQAYESWIAEGHHADMAYMENRVRLNPRELFPEAKTALLFVSYYRQEPKTFRSDAGLIASYARGKDYHKIHFKRCRALIRWLEELSGKKDVARGFSDTAPVLERALAAKAGLGWFGKNNLLIHRRFGTFFLLSGILTSLEVEGKPTPRSIDLQRLPRCGSCTRCLDACPTGALIAPYKLDAALCLSYHLIESKKPLPEKIQKANPGYVFGCDRCQDVCPHNQRTLPPPHVDFKEESGLGAYLTLPQVEEMQEHPERIFGTALTRKKVDGLLKNILSFLL